LHNINSNNSLIHVFILCLHDEMMLCGKTVITPQLSQTIAELKSIGCILLCL